VRWIHLLPLLIAGCGASAPDPAAPLTDEILQRDTNAGRLAYELERDEEATTQYHAALTRAQERDDLAAIGDAGYNLAVVELRANAPDRALADARATRAELERRGATLFPALLLAEATALNRTGAVAEADRAAQAIQRAGDVDAAARATFLRGLIADERGDGTGLAAAVDALNAAKTPPLEADFAELAARLALRRSDPAHAQRQAARAAELRQKALDYRGLAQCSRCRSSGRGARRRRSCCRPLSSRRTQRRCARRQGQRACVAPARVGPRRWWSGRASRRPVIA
jgi:hypothetical protein